MIIKEIIAKSIITKSKLPESDFCINPYVGCSHRCVYCYARFMKRFTGHEEDWGTFVDIKVNAVELLRKKIRTLKKEEGTVLLGSVTDAYQPLEKKYELTRGILQELLKTNLDVSILTKSNLVLRDIDLLKQFQKVSVGISLTSTEEKSCKDIELGAVSISKRLEALKILHDSGIHTYVFIGPIIPGITKLEPIFREIVGKTDEVWGEVLNVRCGNWNDLERCIREKFPDIESEFFTKVKDQQYWNQVEEQFEFLSNKYNIKKVGFYKH